MSNDRAPHVTRRIPPGAERAVFARAQALFPPGNEAGVVGFGIGRCVRAGRTLSFDTLNVYVETKSATPAVPVAHIDFEHDGRPFALRPNVIACGVKPRLSYGGSPLFTGLHVGAAIEVEGSITPFCGIMALLSTTGGAPTHLITAGHTFPAGNGHRVVGARAPGASKVYVGMLVDNLLEHPAPRDAAVVALTAEGVALAHAMYGPRLRRADSVADRAWETAVAFRPTACDWSPSVSVTRNALAVVYFDAPMRGVLSVTGPIWSAGAITIEGDSGTALVRLGDTSKLLGGLVGALGASSVFEPFDAVFTAIRNIYPGARLWAGM